MENNKSCGTDQILNEYLKNTTSDCIKLYTKLFNVILNTGIVPEKWVIGVVKPIYKGKGSKTDPDNYRGITILSCLGKLFTSILEKRLSDFLDHFNMNGPEQAGFKSGFSAGDHMYVLKILIDLFLFNNKRLYMCFVDYKKAIMLVHNMYNQAKSCVSLPDGSVLSMFQCEVGVRQGENLSPLLFSIYPSDLN